MTNPQGMARVTVHPNQDVMLPWGASLESLRAPLARVLRRPELCVTPLACSVGSGRVSPPRRGDVEPLCNDSRVGEFPLVTGCTVYPQVSVSSQITDQPRGAAKNGAVKIGSVQDGSERNGTPPRRRSQRTESADANLRGFARNARRQVRLQVRGSPGSSPPLGELLIPVLVPALGAVAFAATMRQPLMALFALMGVLAVVPRLVSTMRGQRFHTGPRTGPRSDVQSERDLCALIRASARASDGAWSDALYTVRADLGEQQTLTSHVPHSSRHINGHQGIMILGAPQVTRAHAQGLVLRALVTGHQIRVIGAGYSQWSWLRWHTDGDFSGLVQQPRPISPGSLVVVDQPTDADLRHAHDAYASGDSVVILGTPALVIPLWCPEVIDIPHRARHSHWRGPRKDAGISAGGAEDMSRLLATARSRGRDPGLLWRPQVMSVSPGTADGVSHRGIGLGGHTTRTDSQTSPAHGGGGYGSSSASLPDTVALLDLLPSQPLWDKPALSAHSQPPVSQALTSQPSCSQPPGLHPWNVPIGMGSRGPVYFDLVRDGPHLLVAGTTGAGKSALLQSLLWAWAWAASPAELALVLIDFKAGASFGACADLPHVVGQVSDLDPTMASRALAGLRAELVRRKGILARHGVADMEDLPSVTLPRLVVVFDEFRALAEDHPEFLPGLLRIAAQGRSLGIHIVLATQRPSGAVTADVRANISARIALRVTDPAESQDIVEDPGAAFISPSTPGRAILRIGSEPLVVFQGAHASSAPRSHNDLVTLAPDWYTDGWRPSPAESTQVPQVARCPQGAQSPQGVQSPQAIPDSRGALPPRATPALTILTEKMTNAARNHVFPQISPPWLPTLPEKVTRAEVMAIAKAARAPCKVQDPKDHTEGHTEDTGISGELPLALGDLPQLQKRVAVTWCPEDGHLAILGGARTGKTTALVSLAESALAWGWHVHVLARGQDLARFAAYHEHPGFGTATGPHEPGRARRLLAHLMNPDSRQPVPRQQVEGQPQAKPSEARAPMESALEASAPDETHPPILLLIDDIPDVREALATLDSDPIQDALAASASFTVAGTSTHGSLGGLINKCGPRGILLSADRDGDAVLGAPPPLAGSARTPGRAVWFNRGDPVECQVIYPDGTVASSASSPAPKKAHRIARLPRHISVDDLPRTRNRHRVALGIGGHDASHQYLNLTRGALVVGPRGSGKTCTLRSILRRLPPSADAFVVAQDPELLAEAQRCRIPHGGAAEAAISCASLTIVDDAHRVQHLEPAGMDDLAAAAVRGETRVIASTLPAEAVMAVHGMVAHLASRGTGVILHPHERGSAEIFGTPVEDVIDAYPPPPGRAALVHRRKAEPIQLADPR